MRVDVSAPSGSTLAVVRTDVLLPWRAENVAEVRLAAAIVNQRLLLGGFVVDADATLHLRHAGLHPAEIELSDEHVQEWFFLMGFQQSHFGALLQAVCQGIVSVENFAEFVEAAESQEP